MISELCPTVKCVCTLATSIRGSLKEQREANTPIWWMRGPPQPALPSGPAPSPQGSARCCLRSDWTAGCVWTPLPSARQCPETDSCFHSGGRCTWASCQRRSPSLCPASSSPSCACLIRHWSEQSLPKSDKPSETLRQGPWCKSKIREHSDCHWKVGCG